MLELQKVDHQTLKLFHILKTNSVSWGFLRSR